MVTFETLPLEIREHIYSYLLLDDGVIVQETDIARSKFHLRPKFHKSIFLSNRNIGQEAKDYFYARNAFVAIELTNTDDHLDFIQQCCPMNLTRKLTMNESALSIDVIYRGGIAEQGYMDMPTFAVSARRLPLFMRLLNLYTLGLAWEYHVHFWHLKVTSGHQYRLISPRVRESIISSLRLLRPALIQEQDLVGPHIKIERDVGVGIPPRDHDRDWSILGKNAVADVKGLLQLANMVLEQRYYKQAANICHLPHRMMYWSYTHDFLSEQDLCENELTWMTMRITECLARTRLGQKEQAFECAFMAQGYYSFGRAVTGIPDQDRIQISDQVANSLTDHGRLGSIEQLCSD